MTFFTALDLWIVKNINTIKTCINEMMNEVNGKTEADTILEEICNQTGLRLVKITDDDGNTVDYCWSDGEFYSDIYSTPEEAYIAITSRLF